MRKVQVKKHTRASLTLRDEFRAIGLNYDYFVRAAESIVRELKKKRPHLAYIYEKNKIISDFIELASKMK
ncbi:MAG: hypothetical protein ACTSYD_02455 [Candidatus Heimdallarchaeaceae archaeon]